MRSVSEFSASRRVSICLRIAPVALIVLAVFAFTQSTSMASAKAGQSSSPSRTQRRTDKRKKSKKICRSHGRRKTELRKCKNKKKHVANSTKKNDPVGSGTQPTSSPPVAEPAPTVPPVSSCPEPGPHTTPEVVNGPSGIVGGIYQNGGPPSSTTNCQNSSSVAGTITVTSLAGEVIAMQKTESGQLYTIPIAPGTYNVQTNLCTETVNVTVPAEGEVLLDLVCQIR
jgi:hypothetical protein